ncbi:MAG: hypothetical protein ACC657_18705 [Thiohalomonadales bacterium]
MRLTKQIVISVFLTMTLFFTSITVTNATTDKYENFNWVSPNKWEGAVFDVPTWFAKDMLYTGREVIRFHDGFYDETSTGFWTYAFALLIEQTETPTTTALLEETKRYFVGLARGIGDKNIKDYPADKINVTAISDWTKSEQSKYRTQIYQLESFDPFTTGKPINLNLKITTWLCSDSQRAIHYSISPHSMSDPIWKQLDQEIGALKCW